MKIKHTYVKNKGILPISLLLCFMLFLTACNKNTTTDNKVSMTIEKIPKVSENSKECNEEKPQKEEKIFKNLPKWKSWKMFSPCIYK